ncbi:MAG: IclR family transcriptional regulator, acetate operon repressor [Nocardioidaceae bacterium]|jgi:DNA-binding IclR family transcriptional regulator|nr:IclR family transcriptional regulator, acetate operon repressor [Nocardioidaceae bacterium]
MTSARPRDSAVQSVDRAVSILELLADVGSVGVTEVATELAIHKSTAFRLLMTLEARGLVEQDIERGKYRIGYTASLLAVGAAKVPDLADIGRPVCKALAAATGETVNVAIEDGGEVVTVDQTPGRAAVTAQDWVGKRQPMHATAAGKLFLAEKPEPELQAVIDQGLPALTEATLTDGNALRDQLDRIRAVGHATTYEEYESGLVAIAMPIRALGGRLIGALAVSGPSFRMDAQALAAHLAELAPAAAKVSWRAGYLKHG